MKSIFKFVILFAITVPLLAIMPASFYKGGAESVEKDEVAQVDLQEKLDDIDINDVKADPTKWAIIISPEFYDETDNVKFSSNSGKMFEEVARKVLHVSERRTYALIGEDATTGKIKNRLNKLMKFVREGDTIYFYYSGHGIPDIESKEPYILPKDLDPAYVSDEKDFKLANIYQRLQDSKAAKVIAFVDSCFSGATDNKTLFSGVAAPRIKSKTIKIDKTKMVVLTAGEGKQFSNMYKEKSMRMFSYFLIENLLSGKKNINDVFKATKEEVEKTSFELGDQYYQSPTIAGNENMKF